MKFLKILSFVANASWFFLIFLLFFSFYSMIVPFVSIMTQGQEAFKSDIISDPTTNRETLIFRLKVDNPGLIDNKMSIKLQLLSPEGNVLASGLDTKTISAGSTEELLITISLSQDILEDIKPSLLLSIQSRTLFDLVGVGVSTKVESGTSV